MDYKHGAYGSVVEMADKAPRESLKAPVYVGVAPVHQVAGGTANWGRPVKVNSLAEAMKLFGYSDDWATYTLCEAMHAHFRLEGIGPVIFINVMDVEKSKDASGGTISKALASGRLVLENAENIVLDSMAIAGKVMGVDFTAKYDPETKRLTIAERIPGALGAGSLTATYDTVTPEVAAEDIIGGSNGEGTNTGLHAVADVYETCGAVPRYILAPGYSQQKAVHDAMETVSQKINGHFDAHIFTDLPLMDGETPMTLTEAANWKAMNGYNLDNEKTHFPKYKGTDGRIYHLSVLEAVIKQRLDNEAEGIPYQSASNQELPIQGQLYFGEGVRVKPDTEALNQKLCQHGITSAAFTGGRWVLWGAHAASYTQETETAVNIADISLMMLYYLASDFQERRVNEIDTPMTRNRVAQIVAEENAKLDALKAVGAILHGECYVVTSGEEGTVSDFARGDLVFRFNVTTTPLCKSLTALISYTDEGLKTFYEEDE